ncbi:hypothetical protein TNCV_1658911 [Trichonephila clavipes]|nr:hypothetical protein TNCV_1658911 [Trichonephila clavipes]
MSKIRKTSAGLDYPTVSSEEFATVDMQSQFYGRQRHFAVSSKLKNAIDVDSDDENEINIQLLFTCHPK